MDIKSLLEQTNQCVQCGYCLPACPTYLTFEKETHSPRGRINLVKMAAEGQISITDAEDAINLCLGCRACETACPSGVEYGKILEAAKEALYQEKRKSASKISGKLEDAMFIKVFSNSKRLQQAADLIWLYQKTGMQNVAHKAKLTKVLPENLAVFESVLPTVTSPKARKNRPNVFYPGVDKVPEKYKVAFFTGCVMDAVFEKINRLSIEVLAAVGFEVHVISNQTCCGALHAHAGRTDDSRMLAKQNIAAFEKIDADFIVNNAGGCGAMLVEYDHLLGADWSDRAKVFVSKVRDISELLNTVELPFKKSIGEIVTYQHSCHMTNVQKVVHEPLELIKKIPGVIYKEMENPKMCCGSAGIYNVVNYNESMQILDDKMNNAKNTRASIIVTTNPGCLLQMKLGIKREGLEKQTRTLHLVELLAESMDIL
ncbi:(Fe-S)-binding protein [Niallia sp. 01092]|uniref:(Fe-S)-binding protein n=1 Tax=unclassified Niallia TaxID=2837522 RepID=UPI003FD45060